MKTMTCEQLGGACSKEFKAATFEEIAALSKEHGMEMFQAQDSEHLSAMGKMKDLMSDPAAMQEWFEGKTKEFDGLPDE